MVSALFSSFRQCQKQESKGTLLQTSELYIWCIYPLLEECRPYVFVPNSMMSVRKEKIGSEKKCSMEPVWQRETGGGTWTTIIGNIFLCVILLFGRLSLWPLQVQNVFCYVIISRNLKQKKGRNICVFLVADTKLLEALSVCLSVRPWAWVK